MLDQQTREETHLPPLPIPERERPAGYLRRHRRGELSLARSFWINRRAEGAGAPRNHRERRRRAAAGSDRARGAADPIARAIERLRERYGGEFQRSSEAISLCQSVDLLYREILSLPRAEASLALRSMLGRPGL